MKVSEGSKEEIQEAAVSLATANEISQDAVALNGNFTITEEQKMVVFLVRQQTGFCFTVDRFGIVVCVCMCVLIGVEGWGGRLLFLLD